MGCGQDQPCAVSRGATRCPDGVRGGRREPVSQAVLPRPTAQRVPDPDVLLAVMLLQLLVVLIELSEFVGQDIGIRHKIEMLLSESFLHSNDVEAESVFPRDLVTLRKVVNFLVLIEAFIQIALAT